LIIMWLMARRHKINPWLLADILTIGLAFGQTIGRCGNYFNQELFGGPTNLPWKILISAQFRPTNSPTPSVARNLYH
ncbi:MAG: prolipoprotein diacylglyceryl transferase family protein, partial [Armatimonadota bacterium]